MERSQKKWLYISVGFSLVVLIVILYFTINENTIQYLKKINPWFLLLAFLTHILTMCFWAMRVKKMSGSLGYPIKFFYSLNLVFANLLAAAVTPAQAAANRSGCTSSTRQRYRSGMQRRLLSWNGCWTESPLPALRRLRCLPSPSSGRVSGRSRRSWSTSHGFSSPGASSSSTLPYGDPM